MEEEDVASLITVKVRDDIPLSDVDTDTSFSLDELAEAAGDSDSEALAALRETAPDLRFSSFFVTNARSDVDILIQQAEEQDPEYQPPAFDHFFEIDVADDADPDALAEALNAWTAVDYAYVNDVAGDPLITGTGNPQFTSQAYLGAAPDGIDAAAAWAKGADGTDVNFIDIEQGWFLQHEDLPGGIPLLQGTNRQTSFAHGAGVLGEVVGKDDATGICGIAPGATARVVSYNDARGSARLVQRIADRIINVTRALKFGEVMLLEVQLTPRTSGAGGVLPVETDPLVFEAIRLATKVGVIVVEAGGNGAVDLDAFVADKGPNRGKAILNRSGADFTDSGAILVGAATSASPHNRAAFSNFGSRIDCFAWGENIVTTGWNDANPGATDVYWGVGGVAPFGGTSGASPMIVGCCLLLQHLRLLLTPRSGSGKLGPGGMRQCLSNAANGTASFLVTDRIGVMPDFAKIIPNEFQ